MKNKENDKIIATNRKAHFNYFLSDFTEAGLVLLGTEIKSLRQGHCSLSDSYIAFKKGEAFIENMDISIRTIIHGMHGTAESMWSAAIPMLSDQ